MYFSSFKGVFTTNFMLDYPIKDGNWTIRVHAFVSISHVYIVLLFNSNKNIIATNRFTSIS